MELGKLKEYISLRLESLVTSGFGVYDGIPNNAVDYPFVSFSFNSPGSNIMRQSRCDRFLEIDFFIDSNNDVLLLQNAELVKNGTDTIPGFKDSIQHETEGFYKCYMEGDTFEIKEPDSNLTHLKQIYMLHIG